MTCGAFGPRDAVRGRVAHDAGGGIVYDPRAFDAAIRRQERQRLLLPQRPLAILVALALLRQHRVVCERDPLDPTGDPIEPDDRADVPVGLTRSGLRQPPNGSIIAWDSSGVV